MTTPRRAIIAVVALLVFLFLVKSITSTADAPSAITGTKSATNDDAVAKRPYPPPARSRKGQNQVPVQDISSRSLREQLRFHFPYDVETRFPSFIWQTWKTSPSSAAFEEDLRQKELSWTEKHPGFVHEVIVDDAAEHLIKYLYSSIPQVAEAYLAMPIPVLKADLFRYLILLARGGIYTDIDTEALQPAVDWIPTDVNPATIGLVVGIEADPDRDDWKAWYARRIQFCQWTIQSKPGHPVLVEVVARIIEKTMELRNNKQLVKGKQPIGISTMEFTGPGVWTDAIFAHLNDKEYSTPETRNKNITASEFFGIVEHKQVNDVVVLPITSFSPGVGQMGAGDVDDPLAFVHHDFDGSWKPESERMRMVRMKDD